MPKVVRRAVMADVNEILRMGKAFLAASPHGGHDMDDATARGTVENHIRMMEQTVNQQGAGALLLVSDTIPDTIDAETPAGASTLGGMMALLAVPHYFNRNVLMVQECWWWAEDGNGLNLLKVARQWAKARGCRNDMYLAQTGRNDPRMRKLYERMGFTEVETVYRGPA